MPIWTLLSLLEWSFFLRAFCLFLFLSLSLARAFYESFTVGGNLNGKFFYTFTILVPANPSTEDLFLLPSLFAHKIFISTNNFTAHHSLWLENIFIRYDWWYIGDRQRDGWCRMMFMAFTSKLKIEFQTRWRSMKGDGNENGDWKLYAKC